MHFMTLKKKKTHLCTPEFLGPADALSCISAHRKYGIESVCFLGEEEES